MTATECLKKYNIKPNKSVRARKAIEERASEINKEIKAEKGPSRNDLMLQAKAKGIKNFRILNRAELTEVLRSDICTEGISVIVTSAVNRWKSGWGTRKIKDDSK